MVPAQSTPVQDYQENKGNAHISTLTPIQGIKITAIGIFFWYLAAMAVRYGTPLGWFEGTVGLMRFAVTVPIGWITVQFAKWAARLQPAQVVSGVAIGIVAATLCDGIALTWTQALYGSSAEKILPGTAWILWGVGIIMGFAYIDSHYTKR